MAPGSSRGSFRGLGMFSSSCFSFLHARDALRSLLRCFLIPPAVFSLTTLLGAALDQQSSVRRSAWPGESLENTCYSSHTCISLCKNVGRKECTAVVHNRVQNQLRQPKNDDDTMILKLQSETERGRERSCRINTQGS